MGTLAPPNFLSDIFYITLAMNHIGMQKTIGTFDENLRHYDELERHLETVNGDGAWRNVSGFVAEFGQSLNPKPVAGRRLHSQH